VVGQETLFTIPHILAHNFLALAAAARRRRSGGGTQQVLVDPYDLPHRSLNEIQEAIRVTGQVAGPANHQRPARQATSINHFPKNLAATATVRDSQKDTIVQLGLSAHARELRLLFEQWQP
jgi:hypothetical protein